MPDPVRSHTLSAGCRLLLMTLLCLCAGGGPAASAADDVLAFWSSQLNPPREALVIRRILRQAPLPVAFRPFPASVLPEALAGGEDAGLVGGTVGDLACLNDHHQLAPLPLSKITAAARIRPALLDAGRIDSDHQLLIPWIQATYLMVANRKALPYLPRGADLNNLSYAELVAWAENLQRLTGLAKFGFPAGSKGLFHRFIQGYLYPSFTASMITGFRSPEAVTMWQAFAALWAHCNLHSLSFTNMDEPLLSDEVWVAWDHSARLLRVLRERPDDFLVVPAPSGPRGRGSMLGLTGLALPAGAHAASAVTLIDYLLSPAVQRELTEETGFLPVVSDLDRATLSPSLRQLLEAVDRQTAPPTAVISLLPYGLGEAAPQFNQIYRNSFIQIVLRRRNARDVLNEQADKLRTLLTRSATRCFPPDAPSSGPCPVD